MKKFLALTSSIVLTGALLAACRSAPSPEDVHLRAIQEAGVIRVGTSPDFPPYESLDRKGVETGFDIELMTEIAKRLDLRVEWVDMPFKELISAVREGKVDAAIAAFVYTQKRDESVDFTDAYHAFEDAVVAVDPFPATITSDEDLTGYKAGVLRGSSQDRWLTRLLKTQGTPSKGRALRYDTVELATVALTNGRIELLLLDLAAANDLVHKDVGLEIVYQGPLSNAPLRIVVPEGDAGLQRAINEVIKQLHAEGFIKELTSSYFEE